MIRESKCGVTNNFLVAIMCQILGKCIEEVV